MILVVAGGQTSEKTYLTSLQEDVLPLFTKVVGDRSANPRREASEFCGAVIKHRIACSCWFDSSTAVGGSGSGGAFGGGRDGSGVGSVEAPPQAVDVDTELLSVLFILMGDDDDTVRKTSMKVGNMCQEIMISESFVMNRIVSPLHVGIGGNLSTLARIFSE